MIPNPQMAQLDAFVFSLEADDESTTYRRAVLLGSLAPSLVRQRVLS